MGVEDHHPAHHHHRQRDDVDPVPQAGRQAVAFDQLAGPGAGILAHRGGRPFAGCKVGIGVGIATDVAIYFGFHDVIVHRRLAHRYIPTSAYMKRIVQAHRLHHAIESKHHGLSFGFLFAPPVDRLMVQLDDSRAQLRQPASRVTAV
jgi:beta-carotene 3-hydroxylase